MCKKVKDGVESTQHHKTIRNVTVINFKKITSMVVMLSLMLGACGKSPVRRGESEFLSGMLGADTDVGGSTVEKGTFSECLSVVNPWSDYNKGKSWIEYFGAFKESYGIGIPLISILLAELFLNWKTKTAARVEPMPEARVGPGPEVAPKFVGSAGWKTKTAVRILYTTYFIVGAVAGKIAADNSVAAGDKLGKTMWKAFWQGGLIFVKVFDKPPVVNGPRGENGKPVELAKSGTLDECWAKISPLSNYNENKSWVEYFDEVSVVFKGLCGIGIPLISIWVAEGFLLNRDSAGWKTKTAVRTLYTTWLFGGFVAGRIAADNSVAAGDKLEKTMWKAFLNGGLAGFFGLSYLGIAGEAIFAEVKKLRTVEMRREKKTPQEPLKKKQTTPSPLPQ